MDPEYNENKAKESLENAYIRSTNEDNEGVEDRVEEHTLLSTVTLDEYQLVYVDQPRSWRVTKKVSPTEEEVFYMYGVVCECDLPPLKVKDEKGLKKKVLYIRQSVRLTGMGCKPFEEAIVRIRKLTRMAKASDVEHDEQAWQPPLYEGHAALDCSARYFTPRRCAPHEKGLPFSEGVDPRGILGRLRGHDLIHGPDNKVQYFREEETDGRRRVYAVPPADVGVGDIVKATMTLVGYASKAGAITMTPTLKAITVMKKMPRGEYNLGVPRIASIKRKRLFEDDRQAREGMERMSLCDAD